MIFFFFSSRRRHTRFKCDWSSDVCSSDLPRGGDFVGPGGVTRRMLLGCRAMLAGLSPHVLAILPFIFLGALLYTSVGHGGATVYLAILTLAGFAIGPLVTTILVINIVAA